MPRVLPPTEQLSENEAVPLRLYIQTLKVLSLKMNERSTRGFRRVHAAPSEKKTKTKMKKGSECTVGI